MISQSALRLAAKLFEDEEERQRFLSVIEKENSKDPAIVWTRATPEEQTLAKAELKPISPRPGQPEFVWKLEDTARPGKSAWNQNGQIYCLDFSSVLEMFPLNVVLETRKAQETFDVIDVCAAPGGKSVLSYLWLNPTHHISNEVEKGRAFTLQKNLERTGLSSIQVENASAEELAQNHHANLVIVDAPCSGQSLIARGDKNQGAFHPASINGNSKRQRRILAESSHMVLEGGFLLYSTCTYAFEENEKVIEWFLKKFPSFKTVEVPDLAGQQSHLSDEFCYRFFPHRGDGAGGFTCLLKRS